jgi:hypothetical protein
MHERARSSERVISRESTDLGERAQSDKRTNQYERAT